MKNTYYITTPIYYVNDIPHIGHAYTSIACDVIARFMRLCGKEVMFVTGTDEHGQKVEKSSISKCVKTEVFTDMMSNTFRQLMDSLNISYNNFIRTTTSQHKRAVNNLWMKLLNSGDIYFGIYKGWYSIRDEAFYDKSELTKDGFAPTKAPVEWIEEPSYFFALSKWQDKLLKFYDNNPDFIRPNSRRNEMINFIKSGLQDLCISRSTFKWGIVVPNNPKHIIYVWLDALTSYISVLGYPDIINKYWPVDVHVIGKDILRFHAIYWPALLMASDLQLPKCIMTHGWWTHKGHKISKSTHNTINPLNLVQEFGLDSIRYYLMREIVFGSDGNYSRDNLINKINNELSNKIGNLFHRTLSLIYKNKHVMLKVNQNFIDLIYQSSLVNMAQNVISVNLKLINEYNISLILSNIINLTNASNIYIDKTSPWNLETTDPIKMKKILYTLFEVLRYIGIMLQPFIPDSSNIMLDQLGIPRDCRMFYHLTSKFFIILDNNIKKPTPIFLKF